MEAQIRQLRSEIHLKEIAIRDQIRSLPSEGIKAGVGHLFSGKNGGIGLSGALAGVAVTAGTALLGSFLTKRTAAGMAGGLAKSGLVAIAPVLLKMLFRKKTKSGRNKK